MSNLDLLEAVKNRVCDRCRSSFIIPSASLSNHYKCQNCNRVGRANDFPEMTVFDRITASQEVLVEELVYKKGQKLIRESKDYDGWIVSTISIQDIWKSTITQESYKTKPEAIAATLERLKEVENCRCRHSGERGADE